MAAAAAVPPMRLNIRMASVDFEKKQEVSDTSLPFDTWLDQVRVQLMFKEKSLILKPFDEVHIAREDGKDDIFVYDYRKEQWNGKTLADLCRPNDTVFLYHH